MRPTIWPEIIEMIVAEYEGDNDQRAHEGAWWAAEGKTFAELLERVGRADLFGKRHPHQRRLTASAIAGGVAALHRIDNRIQAAPGFLELWFLIRDAFKPVRGLGELAVYDATDRLRQRLGLESEHEIFLHAGARVGARRLAGGRLANEDAWGIHRERVPEGLRHLSTHQIEDILCIYKDELLLAPQAFRQRRGSGGGAPGCGRPSEPRPSC